MARMKYGVSPLLEAEADRLIHESLRTTTRHADKKDILTPWKAKDRRSREIYVNSGVADASIRQGVFGRAANPTAPHLNSTEGAGRPLGRVGRTSEAARGHRGRTVSLAQFVEDNRNDR